MPTRTIIVGTDWMELAPATSPAFRAQVRNGGAVVVHKGEPPLPETEGQRLEFGDVYVDEAPDEIYRVRLASTYDRPATIVVFEAVA